MRHALIRLFVFLQDQVLKLLASERRVHSLLFAKNVGGYRWTVGRWRFLRTYQKALRRVPAYRDFVKKNGGPLRLPLRGWAPQLETVPAMDKETYIKAYRVEARCLDGKLPRTGVMVDESSGSSGTPTSWVRGTKERKATKALLQVGFSRSLKGRPTFVLNAFSLGAWATGMNTTMSLIDLCIMKSTGPDMDKIISTMNDFGPDYAYVILGYPPFLKNLVDDPRINFANFEVVAGFGGEGMSENMRGYLLKHFKAVYGSYGASDIEINLALETDFSISLRRAIEGDAALAADLIRTDYGTLPMIFQYNPYDYILETNEKGEVLVSITRSENINPRLRYNIHDRGHVLRMKPLKAILEKHGRGALLANLLLDLPLLFLYGRSDLSVDFYGAVVPPDSIREVIYDLPELAGVYSNFRLIAYEDAQTNKQLHIALELKEGHDPKGFASLGPRILAAEKAKNRDFDQACKVAKPSTLPTIHIYPKGQGPFALDYGKLKNEYVWHLTHEQSQAARLETEA